MWEKGIELCKELANQYESETFNYSQLSTILVSRLLAREGGYENHSFKEMSTIRKSHEML